MLGIKEVAQILGVSEMTIRRHIMNGDIKTIRYGRKYVIDANEMVKLKKYGFPAKLKK